MNDAPIIYIRRKADTVRRDMFCPRSIEDVPQSLRESGAARLDEKSGCLSLECEGGYVLCEFGQVISYQSSGRTKSGWTCKVELDAERRFEVHGSKVLMRPPLVKAELVTAERPKLLQGARVIVRSSDEFRFWQGHCHQEVSPREGYWVETGVNADGIPTGYILHKNEPVFREMLVCDEYGEVLCTLAEWDRKHNLPKRRKPMLMMH